MKFVDEAEIMRLIFDCLDIDMTIVEIGTPLPSEMVQIMHPRMEC